MSQFLGQDFDNATDAVEVPERVLARLQKILALSKDPGATEAERDTALTMAFNLMSKYKISEAELDASSKQKKVGEKSVIESEEFYGRPWALTIANAVAKLLFCHYFFNKSSKKNMALHSFVGTPSDVLAAKTLARFLIEGTLSEARRQSRAINEGSAWRRSFGVGASHKIYWRCNDLRQEAVEGKNQSQVEYKSGTSSALVLLNAYEDAETRNQNYLVEIGMKLRAAPSRAKKTANPSAYGKGAEHGSKVNLGLNLK